MIDIKLGNKQYKVKEAWTEQEKHKGLQHVESLPEKEGMIFYYDEPQDLDYWMKDTYIPLDIIFINNNDKVISVKQGKPYSEELISEKNVKYVVELNVDSGVMRGDKLEIIDEDDVSPVMKVLSPDGTTQADLWGGERIFSRISTRVMIKKAKKAKISGEESDIRALGRYVLNELHKQDQRGPDYVKD